MREIILARWIAASRIPGDEIQGGRRVLRLVFAGYYWARLWYTRGLKSIGKMGIGGWTGLGFRI
jgi:hypothetical protein